MEFKSKETVLVTGGEGFVASHLVAHLRDILPPTAEIISTSRIEAGGKIVLDITDRQAVDDLISRVRPTTIFHLASIAAPTENVGIGSWETNVFGTVHLAEALLKHRPGSLFVFASTSEAYGTTFQTAVDHKVDETSPLAPTNLYGTTKAAADLYLGSIASRGLNVVRFRPFNHTGPGQSIKFVVPAFASQIAKIVQQGGKGLMRVGNLDAQRDFLDVRDVVRAYAASLVMKDWSSGLIVNIASGQTQRIGDVLAQLIELSGAEVEIEPDPSRMRESEIPIARCDAHRAGRLFGWKPTIPWEKTLRDVLDSFLYV